MSFKKLLTLCKSKRLKTVVENIYNQTKANGYEAYIYADMVDALFDVEIKEDYGEDVFSYFDEGEYKKNENDGWQDSHIEKNFARLLKGWKWENIQLSTGNILIVSQDDLVGDVSFNILNFKNIRSGSIEMRMMFPQNFYETRL